MTRIELIAIEFGVVLPETVPILQVMYLASAANKRREDRKRALQEGKQYNG